MHLVAARVAGPWPAGMTAAAEEAVAARAAAVRLVSPCAAVAAPGPRVRPDNQGTHADVTARRLDLCHRTLRRGRAWA